MKKSRCGARTRAGHPCKRKGLGKGGRCPNHGGMSTGPRTIEGRQRIAEAQRRRWKANRAKAASIGNSPGFDCLCLLLWQTQMDTGACQFNARRRPGPRRTRLSRPFDGCSIAFV